MSNLIEAGVHSNSSGKTMRSLPEKSELALSDTSDVAVSATEAGSRSILIKSPPSDLPGSAVIRGNNWSALNRWPFLSEYTALSTTV
jgi:hypothetical protein